MWRPLCYSLALVVGFGTLTWGQETEESTPEIFSGPQAGERLVSLKVKGVYGEQAGKSWDVLEKAGDQPKLLIFLHKRT
ncbi:MAG: hypothetical protein KDA84_18490, partial [Planctomycetaceae bacterium]|nr:hypothetical protein [Planctomycetaceae bacterium]